MICMSCRRVQLEDDLEKERGLCHLCQEEEHKQNIVLPLMKAHEKRD